MAGNLDAGIDRLGITSFHGALLEVLGSPRPATGLSRETQKAPHDRDRNHDELLRRQHRLFERPVKYAGARDAEKHLEVFGLEANKRVNRALVFQLAARKCGCATRVALLLFQQVTAQCTIRSERREPWA
jgi:hypothetical protein